jgi:hypothetical protein
MAVSRVDAPKLAKIERHGAILEKVKRLAANPSKTQFSAALDLSISPPTLRRILRENDIVWVHPRRHRAGHDGAFTKQLRELAADPEVSMQAAAIAMFITYRTLKGEMVKRRWRWVGDDTAPKPVTSGQKSRAERRTTRQIAHELNSEVMPWLPE